MLNSKTKSKNRSHSTFLGQRRKRERPVLAKNFSFVKENHGSISTHFMEGGIVQCIFSSKSTGRKAFAFGASFDLAYVNMIKRFNEKYGSYGKAI